MMKGPQIPEESQEQTPRPEFKMPSIPEEMPLLPSEIVPYPFTGVPLMVSNPKWIKLIDDAVVDKRMIALFAIKEPGEEFDPEKIYQIGTACLIVRMLKLPEGKVQIGLQGLSRIKMVEITQTDPYPRVKVEVLHDVLEKNVELEALHKTVVANFQKFVSTAPNIPQEVAVIAMNIPEPGHLADFIATQLNLSLEERQNILEELNVIERLKKVSVFLAREQEILELGAKIQSQAKEQMSKVQREYFLREQLKAIKKELGEADDHMMEIEELRKKVEESGMPPEAKKEAERELNRMERMNPESAEYTVARTYLDWLVNLPWQVSTEDNLNILRAEGILDEDHYDLQKVKDRILDYLAVRKLKADMRGPILCFVGPPGVGKTSLGQSIARALGRKFVRISLGGIRDEAEIRGHRRTYIGSLPGRIIQGIRRAGSNNPVFMLDEIDKLGADFRGDPSAALLEVLDPEQNFAFVDHYLDVPFDLSKVMFITTANTVFTIPPALLDRMEVIEIPGYTEHEKVEIAKQYLIPRQMKEHGLGEEDVLIEENALRKIIRNYTREAGVRNLERQIGTICRKVARRKAEGKEERMVVGADDLLEILGPEKFKYELAGEKDEVGVVTGLAWTEAGGDILFIEAKSVPGKGDLILTGQLGDVMQESAQAALTYVRAYLAKVDPEDRFYEKKDIHVHVPSGAIPKDGPSAGIAIATAIYSDLTGKKVRKDVGMTGEITLRGRVLPIGGVKEKVLSAHRAGLKTIILPKENEKDLDEVPEHVKEELDFVFVEHVDEVLKVAIRGEG
jgi:ATP-dependent Lon protease